MTQDNTSRRRGLFGEEILPFGGGLQRMFDTVIPELMQRSPLSRTVRSFMPNIDIEEDEQEIRVVAELPGMSEEDIDITVSDRTLVLKGEKRCERKEEGDERGRPRVFERTFGTFERRVMIPSEVEQEQIEATFDRGILTIRLPKTEKAKAEKRKIPIRGGSTREKGPAGAVKDGGPSSDMPNELDSGL